MDSRLKALASQDAAWTEIANKEAQLETILVNGLQDESDMELIQGTIMLVLEEIAWRKAELLKLHAEVECELVVEGEYQIAFMNMESPSYTWFDGPATFVGLDPDDYGTDKPHGCFRIEDADGLVSFPLSSVGKRLK